MDKKLRLSIIYVVLLSLFIGGAILFSKPTDKGRYNSKTFDNGKSNTVIADNNQESINAYKNESSKNEILDVFNNGANIDLHANLIENKSGQVSLNLAYKLNGKLITKKLDTSNISEIRNIFRFREQHGKGYRLNNIILNEKMNKLYFYVEGKKDRNYTHTTIYSYGLKDSKIEKILYDFGDFSEFSFSPNGKYNAFSYLSCSQNITHNEKSIVVIIRCSDNKIMLNSNKDILEKQDDKGNDLYVYSYNFIKWQNNNICELRQKINVKYDSQKVINHTIFYNLNNLH